MGRRQGTKKARRANDLYNAEDQDPVEERQAGRRYDVSHLCSQLSCLLQY